ncbi:MAG: hypothetical protein MUF54_25155, partial [Polyangiaceae bacterium]|nr:hypothetical protein [Polyangiaceae bacterium]
MPGRVPVGVCDALQRACAIRPKDRYPTAEAFATDLRGTVDTSQRAPSSHPSLLPSASSRPHAGQTRPAGSAVVDPAAPTVAEHAGLTRMDGSRPMGPGGTRALRGAAQQELTERIDLAQSVDRDARTMRHGADARLLGPGGTELLPAVAARRSLSPPEPEGRVTGPASEAQPVSAYSAAGRLRAGLLASGWFAWVAGLFAFLVPVSLAAIFGYRHLSAPVEQPSSAASLPAVTASAAPAVTPLGSSMVQPAEEAEPVAVDLEVPRPPAHALPELRGPSSKAKVASTTSAPAPSARSSAVFRAAKPAAKVAATAATAVPKPVLAPPSKAEPHVDRRMPKSGL